MGCCGGNKEDKLQQEGVIQERKCRDVLFLLFFLGFWCGMFVVCGMAFKKGDATRLAYGMDSFGLQCGSINVYNNSTIDLRDYPNKYYLNALDLLSLSNIPFAKSICVKECPKAEQVCNASSLPCTNSSQYMCPYYRFAEKGLYGELGNLSLLNTQYFDDLSTAQIDACNASFASAAAAKVDPDAFGFDASSCNSSNASISGAYYKLTSQFPSEGPCYPIWVETVEYYHRCFPKFPSSMTTSVISVASSGANATSRALSYFRDDFDSHRMSNYISDISKGMLIIVIGGLVAGVVLSMVWMIILRYFAGVMAWLTILLVNVAFLGCTLYAYNEAGMLSSAGSFGKAISEALPEGQDPTDESRRTWKYIAYGATAATVLVFLLTLLMIRRVKIAVACIKVASQAVAEMPSIVFFPILPFIMLVGLVIYWVAVTAVLYSAGDPTPNYRNPAAYEPYTFQDLMLTASGAAPAPVPSPPPAPPSNMTREQALEACTQDPNCYISIDWDTNMKYAFIYHLFGLLWTNQFIVGFACVVIANAVANFYWHRGDTAGMPTFPVVNAMRTTTFYHLGSIAFGAFIIAVVQFIRVVLEYINRKTQQLQQQNQVLKFINRNAYIMVAVKGSSYCTAAGDAIALIIKNSLRLLAVNLVGDSLIFLGKLAVAAGGGIVAFLMANTSYYNDAVKYPDTYLSSAVLPIALAVGIAFIVAEIFFAVYEMAVDTILLSFCEDCEHNNGQAKYAPPLLLETLGER